jgi:hypothetical protein
MTLIRNLRKKFGISAPKMTVRIKLPWYWRGVETAIAVVLLISLVIWAFHLGREFTGLMASNVALIGDTTEEAFPDDPKAIFRELQMQRATREHLARQVKLLDAENSKLKEDLAFFQNFMPAGSKDGVSINQLKVQRDGVSGDYRYRLFLMQTGNRQREFKGTLELIVNIDDDGVAKAMVLPAAEGGEANRVNFKFYQRIEGTFRVAPDQAVTGLEVRLFESGAGGPRAVQSVTLS